MTDRASRSRAEHNMLSLELIEVARALYAAAAVDDDACLAARDVVVDLYRTRLAPHLDAEGKGVLTEAAEVAETHLLGKALLAQRRALDARVHELADATTGLDAVAAARAVQALFSLHALQVDDFLLAALDDAAVTANGSAGR